MQPQILSDRMPVSDINIIIADPQLLVREGLKSLIAEQSGMSVIGEAANRPELTQLLQHQRPDILVMDYSAADAFSPNDVEVVKDARPLAEVLIISADLDKNKVKTAMGFGAKGFLTKDCGKMEILGALEASARGEKFFCNKVLDIILEREEPVRNNQGPCDPVRFTDRELEIVKLMAEGSNAQEIADTLSLSVHTVYTHRKNIHKKLGVSNATEVVLHAIRSGLVEGPEALN
ncbi:MAG: response regulator transcription factor [Bacteroidia bacterium]